MTTWRRARIGIAVIAGMTCLSAAQKPKPAPARPIAQQPVEIPIDRKAAWILRLEQQRVLADPAAGADLAALIKDVNVGVRRRTALALGRIGGPETLPLLIPALSDADESVRRTAAFAIGLVGDAQGAAPLEKALADPAASVRGRAAEALGLVGSTASASAVAAAAKNCPSVIAAIPPDDEGPAQSPDVEACRLSILALVRLKQYDALARVVLDANGQPVSAWWPVAFALQRIGDPRAATPLAALLPSPGIYTQAFALRGLATLKDARAVTHALALADRADADVRLRAVAIRALGQLADPRATAPLLVLVRARTTPANLMLEAIPALGAIGDRTAFDTLVDLFGSRSPYIRAAAMAAASRMDTDAFLLALSSTERDRDWIVRAGLAGALATLPPDRARPVLLDMASDPDLRVQAAVLQALARAGAPDIDRRAIDALSSPDMALRSAAASLLGDRKPPAAVAPLVAAYGKSVADADPSARLALLDALGAYPSPESTNTIRQALDDREWPVRLKAAALLKARGVNAAPARPAPLRQDPAFFESDRFLRPKYSPQAYVETAAGTVQIQLDVVDTPSTSFAFIELARAGFFNGLKVHRLIPNFVIQAGDPRGDGEGGPGYTIRDEFTMAPFVRGSVGMALAGPETGGSQFFITVSPQPHLDARYTLFGHVVAGMDLLDRVSLGDVILKITIDDGTGLRGA
ncbi:MAG TPA: HEAT repeat domain-containing protein [Vicinamibacterales bacterium]|nr:HEAT repeat domain-containing protein [Vicinamibacterales bacterium]